MHFEEKRLLVRHYAPPEHLKSKILKIVKKVGGGNHNRGEKFLIKSSCHPYIG